MEKRLGFTEIMVDTETTGTRVSSGGVCLIQIAATEFNYETGETGKSFCASMLPEPWAVWDPGTVNFWRDQGDLLPRILESARPAGEVLRDFINWVGFTPVPRFWARPISFDFPLIERQLFDNSLLNPFHFYEAVDVHSFIRGSNDSPVSWKLHKEIPFVGDKHDAFCDVRHQIKTVLEAKCRREMSDTLRAQTLLSSGTLTSEKNS